MKKVLIASGAAILAFTMIASAQGYTFNANLTVGSTGPDVVALQTWLNSNGYSIPSIASGAAAPGYFGSQTQAAVKKYQAAKGIPSTGFVGPLTRGALNAGGGVATTGGTTVFTCPAGYTCTANPGTTPTNGTTVVTGSPAGITTPGVAGTLTVANGTAVANGTTVNDGQSVDVAGYDLQPGSSDMQLNSITVDFSVRPWLYFNSFTLVNRTTGATIATVSGLSQSNFTEITVGSDYRITIPVTGVVIPKATKQTVVLHGVLNTSIGRSNVNIYVTRVQTRATDGTGVVDNETLGDGTTSNAAARYVGYQGSLTANLVVTLDPAAPLKQVIQTNSTNPTNNVVLGMFQVKSQNLPSTLQGLVLTVNTNTGGAAVATDFNNIQLQSGALTYYGSINTTTGSTTFTNMAIPLAQDTFVPIKIVATVAKNITSGLASTSLDTATVANFTGQDTSFNNPTVTNSGWIASADVTFSLNGVAMTSGSVAAPVPITISNSTKGASLTYTFTLTAGNSPLYVANNTAYAVATSSNLAGNVASSSISTITSATTLTGDTATAFQVPAGGSRTFVLSGSMNNANNPVLSTVNAYLNITKIYYSTSGTISSVPSTYIDFGLNALQSTPILLSN